MAWAEMALPRSLVAPERGILALRIGKRFGRQFVDQRAVHLLVELEIEGVERAIGIAEARLFQAALEEAVLSTQEPSETRIDTRSIGASDSVWACRKRVSRTAAMPGQAELVERVRARSAFIAGLLFYDRQDDR